MDKRSVMRLVFEGKKPPYVPWWFWFTSEAADKLKAHYRTNDLDSILDPHIATFGHFDGFFTALPDHRFKDYFGVIWDRSIDHDIGVVENCLLPEPTLKGFTLPNPLPQAMFDGISRSIEATPDRFRVFMIGFSLYERAWTLRGMENLMMDFLENPAFVHELLDAICDYNITQVREALKHDFEAIYFGDDWGQQFGLQMGYPTWRKFIYPRLKRMYTAAVDAGKYVMIHSCGDVDELFDDLVGIGLNCFNPFQPEVMDVYSLLPKYRGRLAFHGGLSTQKTLPFGTAKQVAEECRKLLELGADGGYIFNAAHAVKGDVPLENLLAMIDAAKNQRGYRQIRPPGNK